MSRGTGAETGEGIRSVRGLPATACGEPTRVREVMESHYGGYVPLTACGAHAAVVVERSYRELAFGGLDPAPLEREPVGPKTHARDQLDVVVPVMQRVTCIPARLGAAGTGGVLPCPPVVVYVAALDLMCCGRRAPQESVGETDLR